MRDAVINSSALDKRYSRLVSMLHDCTPRLKLRHFHFFISLSPWKNPFRPTIVARIGLAFCEASRRVQDFILINNTGQPESVAQANGSL